MKKIIITAGTLILVGVAILIGVLLYGSQKSANKSRQLIIYFTLSGNTKKAAEALQQDTDADIIRLRPKKAYPTTYDAAVKVAKKELATKTHPAIATAILNLEQYKTIYVGFPTWWRQPPMIIHTLFDTVNFKNKTIVPFTTSMESPISSSVPYLQKMADKDDAKLVKGIRYTNNNNLKRFLITNDLITK